VFSILATCIDSMAPAICVLSDPSPALGIHSTTLRLRSGLRFALARFRRGRLVPRSRKGGETWGTPGTQIQNPHPFARSAKGWGTRGETLRRSSGQALGHPRPSRFKIPTLSQKARKGGAPARPFDEAQGRLWGTPSKSQPFRKKQEGWSIRSPLKIFTVSQRADSSPLKRIRNDKSKSGPERGTSEAKAVQSGCRNRSAEALRHPN
jgi:hypothetical protein